MEHRLLGFFSGFPDRRFPPEVAGRLDKALACRDSLVFVSAWPEDYERNDSDAAGMYQMFVEYGISFARRYVIDCRTEAPLAVKWIQGASCIFLMGGHPGQQFRLIQDKGLGAAIRESTGVVLGVSAGAINMARRSLDTKESPVPYEGLGLADITVKPHFDGQDQALVSALLEISMELPICAMRDNSAIFAAEGEISCLGQIDWVEKGRLCPFSQAVSYFSNKK